MAEAATPTRASAEPPTLPKFSCLSCHRRKVRCDRQVPCTYCLRRNSRCVYQAPPAPKRRKRDHPRSHADLLARLQRAEDQLRLSGLVTPSPAQPAVGQSPATSEERTSTAASTPSSTVGLHPPVQEVRGSGAHTGAATRGRLIKQGTSTRYLDNNLWVTLDNELQDSGELIRAGESGGLGSEDGDDEASAMLLDTATVSDHTLLELFPSQRQQEVLWRAYTDNVHYLTMILHRPSFQKVVDLAKQRGLLALSKGQVALIFSAYFSALASLSNAQCEMQLGEPRRVLLKRLRAGTRLALVRAQFIRSTNLTTLQAFVHFLLCMRNGYDSQTLWVLAGAAFRIAQRMGLHREEAEAEISPFECEMRRRLWRQLLILDFTSSELAGSAPGYTVMLGLDANSRIPLNVNDEDLREDMKELPEERFGATDMIFCRLRYEFGCFFLLLHQGRMATNGAFDATLHRISLKNIPLEEKDRQIEELENKLQMQYLRFCDPINRLHQLTSLAARAAIAGMRLRAHHPRQYTDGGLHISVEESSLLFALSIKIMQYDVHCHTQPALQGYLWHIRIYFPYHALIYLLNALRVRKIGTDVEDAWALVEQVFENHPEIVSGEFAVYRAIRAIALRAWDAREREVRRQGQTSEAPKFVRGIREKRRGRSSVESETVAQELPTPLSAALQSQSDDDTATETEHPVAGHAEQMAAQAAGLPYTPAWLQEQNATPQSGGGRFPDTMGEMRNTAEHGPIDWAAWDALVQGMDLPTLGYGLDAFFR